MLADTHATKIIMLFRMIWQLENYDIDLIICYILFKFDQFQNIEKLWTWILPYFLILRSRFINFLHFSK